MTNVAIIGHGYWGPNLLRNYMEIPGASVKWVCDPRPEALEKVRRRNPSQATTQSYDEVLADAAVDAVVIATPISTHFDLAAAALRATWKLSVAASSQSRLHWSSSAMRMISSTRSFSLPGAYRKRYLCSSLTKLSVLVFIRKILPPHVSVRRRLAVTLSGPASPPVRGGPALLSANGAQSYSESYVASPDPVRSAPVRAFEAMASPELERLTAPLQTRSQTAP